MSLTLSPDELRELTRRDRPAAQARVLAALGVPFKAHPTDGVLVVSRMAAEKALGTTVEVQENQPIEWDLNMEGFKRGTPKAA